MRRRLAVMMAATALVLVGCTGAQTSEGLPRPFEALPEALGGLPADAPSPPKKDYQYPAVHDMPPPRSIKPLSDSELLKLENDLKSIRDKQEKAAGPQPIADAPVPAKAAAKSKKPAAEKAGTAHKP